MVDFKKQIDIALERCKKDKRLMLIEITIIEGQAAKEIGQAFEVPMALLGGELDEFEQIKQSAISQLEPDAILAHEEKVKHYRDHISFCQTKIELLHLLIEEYRLLLIEATSLQQKGLPENDPQFMEEFEVIEDDFEILEEYYTQETELMSMFSKEERIEGNAAKYKRWLNKLIQNIQG